jgi:hypothetical protein
VLAAPFEAAHFIERLPACLATGWFFPIHAEG